MDFMFIYHFFGYAAWEIYMYLAPGENVDQTKYNWNILPYDMQTQLVLLYQVTRWKLSQLCTRAAAINRLVIQY